MSTAASCTRRASSRTGEARYVHAAPVLCVSCVAPLHKSVDIPVQVTGCCPWHIQFQTSRTLLCVHLCMRLTNVDFTLIVAGTTWTRRTTCLKTRTASTRRAKKVGVTPSRF